MPQADCVAHLAASLGWDTVWSGYTTNYPYKGTVDDNEFTIANSVIDRQIPRVRGRGIIREREHEDTEITITMFVPYPYGIYFAVALLIGCFGLEGFILKTLVLGPGSMARSLTPLALLGPVVFSVIDLWLIWDVHRNVVQESMRLLNWLMRTLKAAD